MDPSLALVVAAVIAAAASILVARLNSKKLDNIHVLVARTGGTSFEPCLTLTAPDGTPSTACDFANSNELTVTLTHQRRESHHRPTTARTRMAST